jgi:hypothetical protein
MAKPPKLDDPQAQAAALGLAEKLLMISIASRTEWERAGITGTTADRARRGRRARPHQTRARSASGTAEGRRTNIQWTKGGDMITRTSESVSTCLADWVGTGNSMPPRDPNDDDDDDDDEEEEDGDAESEEDEPAVIREPDE